MDDMVNGCGFKTENILDDSTTSLGDYIKTSLRAVNFYYQNRSIWNLLIENCLKHKTDWDFKTIEKMNNIYEDII